MGRGKRGLLAAAVTVVCAVTVLAVPGTAFASVPAAPADPSPVPSATATPATPAPAVPPAPVPDAELEKVRARLDGLYHDAAVATDAYNAAEEKTRKQSVQLARLEKRTDAARKKLAELKDQAGAAARAQYRDSGMPPMARFLLSDNPEHFADGAGTLLNGARATKKLIAETDRVERELKRDTDDAAARWKKLERDRKDKAAARKTVQARIKDAEKLESRLEKKEKERLAELERQAARKAQTAWLDTGVLKKKADTASATDTATSAGAKAVAFATAQLGKPYVWGAEGPDSFDCSGLTSQAWADAGTLIPRTSQEQWKQLTHVDVTEMRPGDLIIYFADATHVGMYVGDGKVIHAPRPGRTVTVAGAGTMPILGVVRPDA
ncbi:glycoside hydrolase [Streptomyces griseoluteus]|uniref:Glycoside hydrolase n=1 Tax=Streptomyces griseoluteus TaxID=29306 RepID=A0A4Z1DKA1_STRGP|nr:C40 family peptidase [Streptomyces griseoluteus]TGN83233.1 glycoside hydrolase [Streptomyces griseoluteus]GHF19099.1 glycoside hydrolase [Streptomyces griseoluteus]